MVEESGSLCIGFLGCGKISCCLVRGLASYHQAQNSEDNLTISSIIVSPRSTSKSSMLSSEYPGLVGVGRDNQEVVDQADVILIGLLPQVAQEILPTLAFPSDKTIISMMATVPLDTLCALLPKDLSSPPVR